MLVLGKFDQFDQYKVFAIIVLCCAVVVWGQGMEPVIKRVVQGLMNQNILIQCDGNSISFWILNGSVYGLLQTPSDFTACTQTECDPNKLRIPVLREELDGYTFQCGKINYNQTTHSLGQPTVLEVVIVTLPTGNLAS